MISGKIGFIVGLPKIRQIRIKSGQEIFLATRVCILSETSGEWEFPNIIIRAKGVSFKEVY